MVKIFGFEPRRSRAKNGRFLVELRGIQRPISRRTPDPRIGFGNVKRDQQTRYDGHFIGSELQNPDFVALADSFGVDSYWVDRPEDLQKSLKAALAKDVPALIEVKTDQASETSPWKFIVQRK